MNLGPTGRGGSARWRAGGIACLIAGAFLIAGLVLGARRDDGAAAATTPSTGMSQPAAVAPAAPGTPLTPAPGATGRPLVAPAVYTSRHGELVTR